MNRFGRLALALLAARVFAEGGAQPLLAQPADQTVAQPAAEPAAPSMPPETVTVRESPDGAAADPTGFSTVIRADDFADRITTLPDLLRAAVGVQIKSLGGDFATVSIRGSSAEQVVVYLDGVPLNRALGGGVNLADLPLAQIDSIEIHRGFTPAGLSTASIGGAILIHSKAAGPGAHGEVKASAGSFGSGAVSGSWSATHDRGAWLLGVDAATSQGDFTYHDDNGTPLEPGDDATTRRVNNAFTHGHLLARGSVQAGRTRLSFNGDLFGREQGVPGIDAFQSEHSRYDNSRLILSTQAEAPGLLGGRLLLRGGVAGTRYNERFDGATGEVPSFDRRTDNRIASLDGDFGGTLVAGGHQAFSFLAALREETADLRNGVLDPPEIGKATRTVSTFTLEDQIELASGRLVLNPSLRHERYGGSFEPGPSAGIVPKEAPDAAVTTGKAGFRVRAAEGLQVRGNAGSFLRLPDITELFGDQGSVKGNPGLVPEHGWNADLGVIGETTRPRGSLRSARVEASLFQTEATDLIVYVPNAQNSVIAQNIGRARIRGLELSFGMLLGRRFSGSFNAVHQTAVDTSDRFSAGNQLPGRPQDELSAEAGLALGKGRLAYEFTYVGSNYVNTVNTASGLLPARYLHDLSYRLRLPRQMEATFQVRNLLDEQTVDVARFPLPGRSFEARLAWAY